MAWIFVAMVVVYSAVSYVVEKRRKVNRASLVIADVVSDLPTGS
jgi:hypothetical protein